MFSISIFKHENRRKDRDRENSDENITESRASKDRRTVEDRRSDTGRRTGLYYSLPENQKDTVDAIINILEKKLER
jgi:hypothetical protein